MSTDYAICYEGRLADELKQLGARVEILGAARFRHPLSVWRSRKRLARFLHENSYDVVVVHSCWAQVLFGKIARSSGALQVYHVRDTPTGSHWLEKIAKMSPPDLVICNSQFSAGRLSLIYKSVMSEVVYGLITPQTMLTEPDRYRVRQELGVSPETVVIAQVSRLEEWKGHGLHLQALAGLKDVPGWTCWIIGGAQRLHEQTYFDSLKGLAKELGIDSRVRFLGQRTDARRLLCAADIHCQPNTGPEPFGLTFVEALSAAIPVVTTALGGALEIVDDSCGLLVPVDDPEALADALSRLIQDRELRQRLGSAGPRRASYLCDPKKQLNKLYTVFNSALNGYIPRQTVPGELLY
ncbi:MAG: glycosyltransferase family 4 protein [Pyrinomonadaceae bacterium]